MASVYDLKPRFQALLRPIAGFLAKAGVTANQVTIAAVLLSLATGAALLLRPWAMLLLPATLVVRMALNAIDGMLAREHDQRSRLGAVLNELGDAISDCALYLPFARVPGISGWLVILVVVLALVGELAGVVAVQIGAQRRYDGPMGKSDRATVFGGIGLLLGLGVNPGRWTATVLTAAAVLGVLTIVNRVRRALATAAA
jgi:CDP-diacylglycerol---glycerol-3-phosphate 3-phosphatidyltransferase